MLTRPELEAMHLTRLTVLCERIAEKSRIDPEITSKAGALKDEWVGLVASEPPPPISYSHIY